MRTFSPPFWRKPADAVGALVANNSTTNTEAPTSATTPASQATRPAMPAEARPATRVRHETRRPQVTADDIYFTTKQAAQYMHFLYSHRSLERLRCEGGDKGPAFVKMPGPKGKILYPKTELDRWLQSLRRYHSTSEYDT